MSEEDNSCGELKEGMEVFRMVFIADHQSSEVVKPGKEALDFPTLAVAAQSAAVIVRGLGSSLAMGSQQDHILIGQFLAQGIAVIGLIRNNVEGLFCHVPAVQSLLDKSYLRWRSSFCVEGDRKTTCVCNCHDLGALAAFGFSNFRAPFLAVEKLPSKKVSSRLSFPRLRRSSASPSSITRITPAFTHPWNRR